MKAACPVCGGIRREVLESIDVSIQHAALMPEDKGAAECLTRAMSGVAHQYSMLKCLSCELEFAAPFRAPTPEWYAVLYSNCALFPVARWEFSHVAAKLKPRDVVVDFGCGSGAFLRSITGKVSKGYGYDFADDAICSATASGIEAYRVEPLADLAVIANKGATQIVAFHVLEHIESPSSLFEFAGNVSLDEATLWIAVPSNKRPSRRYVEIDELDKPPHHLTRWSPKALQILGANHGWTMISLSYEPATLRARVWEVSRRLRFYRTFAKALPRLERLLRACMWIPVCVLKHAELRGLSGFSMLATYVKKSVTQ